jgi:4'-phosphopantetheinyl transferase
MAAGETFFPHWPATPLRDSIDSNDIHVWAWSLDPPPADQSPETELAETEILDRHEIERMQAFYFVRDRDRYACTHRVLRKILGAYLHCRPEDLQFRTARYGKPELTGHNSFLHFNLSHSPTIAIVAVGRQPVGIDIEEVHPIEEAVAEMNFSPAELCVLKKLRGDAWLTGFFRCWTRKEAILKAEGAGLQRALDSFDVGLSARAELLATRQPFQHDWTLHNLEPCPNAIAALATPLRDANIHCFSL